MDIYGEDFAGDDGAGDEEPCDSGYAYSDYYGEGGDDADEEIGLAEARSIWDRMQSRAFKEANEGPPALCVHP